MARFRLTDGTREARLALVVDVAALLLFIVAGMRSHRTASQLEIFARNAVPLGGAWLVIAAVAGTYRPPSFPRLLATWAIAVPVGVLARSWWTGSPRGEDLLVFGGVALVITLAFLAGGRALSAVLGPRLWARSSA